MIPIEKKIYGKDQLITGQSYSDLGNCLINLGDFEGAQSCFKKALAIKDQYYEYGHPDLVELKKNIHILKGVLLLKGIPRRKK